MKTLANVKKEYENYQRLLQGLYKGAQKLGATGSAKELKMKLDIITKFLLDLDQLQDNDPSITLILNPETCFELYTYLSTNNGLTKQDIIKKLHQLFTLTETYNLDKLNLPSTDDPFELYCFLYPFIQLDFERTYPK